MSTDTDSLLNRLPHDFRRRMASWARWKVARADGVHRSVGVSSIYRGKPRGGLEDAPLPHLTGEARDTDAALQQLAPRRRLVVESFWVADGQTVAWCARQVGIDPRTFAKRLEAGHDDLRAAIARRRESFEQIHSENESRAARTAERP